MNKNDFLICYDIADAKRLAKIARYLEKITIRVQNSIFLLPDSTRKNAEIIATYLDEMIDPKEDDIRIYTIKEHGVKIGRAVDLSQPFLINQ